MQVSPEQLESRLGGALAPVYFISGDEPLRVMEAADAVRARATAEGFAEREVLTVSAGFDWSSLTEAAGSLSLFASRRVLDLRLPGGKPGEAGAKALRAYAGAPPADTLLLITAGKLEPSARKSRWVQALDRVGVVVFVWPLNSRQLPGWVNARLHRRGLEATPQAAALLAERVEGNLLACVQESFICCWARAGLMCRRSPARLPTAPALRSMTWSMRRWQGRGRAASAF
jgi:DNA polymerase-3 subunit delta